jgi:Cdc6-like AAA superfamily ATPase
MSSQIIINPETLSQSYIPEKVLHRDKEFTQLSNALNFVNTFVHGANGSGKTLLVKCVIENFNSTKKGIAIYIDCSLYQTTNAIFHEILSSLSSIVSSKSNYDLTKRLKARLRHLDCKVTVCLDHFDFLKEIETLNRLLSLGLGLMIVSESRDAYGKLDAFAKAKITNIIEIPSYTNDQTFEILLRRAEETLEKYAYSEETIRKIAEVSSGNVTLALNLLKSQALKAESEGKSSIDDVELEYEVDCPDENLSRDEKIIVKTLEEWKSLPSSRLYDFYVEKARHPKGRRSFRNYMQDLCTKGYVRIIGEKRGRVYEIVEQPRLSNAEGKA